MEALRALYFTPRLWLLLGALTACFVLGHFFSFFFLLAQVGLAAALALLAVDLLLLYRTRQGIAARRLVPERLSNGDDNPIRLYLENHYPFPLALRLLDELPPQFQKRDFDLKVILPAGASYTTQYTLHPLTRGEQPHRPGQPPLPPRPGRGGAGLSLLFTDAALRTLCPFKPPVRCRY